LETDETNLLRDAVGQRRKERETTERTELNRNWKGWALGIFRKMEAVPIGTFG
jgi:hypothetical protein